MNISVFKDLKDIRNAKLEFDKNGFCVFSDLIDDHFFAEILRGVEDAIENKKLFIRDDKMNSNDDIIFAHPAIESASKNESIVAAVRTLIGSPVNLQHAKFNAKPKAASTANTAVEWHQDFPFYPHTNFDLVTCIIHLDDEDCESGSMVFVPESHKKGVLNHCDEKGNFKYCCSEPKDSLKEPYHLITPKKWISFHHCLTLHYSGIKTNDKNRRYVIFQYRAEDAIQLAGVLWRCNGYKVDPLASDIPIARFPNGEKINLRGKGGRLYDVFGILEPDKKAKQY